MSETRTEISSLGEFALINHLTRDNEIRRASTLLSVGDDGAVIDHFGKQTVISTDMLVEGVHFDMTYTPLKHLGYKAVAVNLSDICAMLATPTQITVSLAVSNRYSVEAIDEIYSGIYAACEKYTVDLVGGDTTTSPKGLVMSITAIGEVAPDKFVTRAGAQENDIICVTGNLGAAYLGLQLLEREKKIYLENPSIQPELQQRPYIIGRFLKPEPRVDISEWLEEHKIVPTSMIDISDGLSSDLLHICTQSEKGCEIFENKIPIHEESIAMADEFQINPLTCALNGGEDYELLFTINQKDLDTISKNPDISTIGFITADPSQTTIKTEAGNSYKLKAQGWNAFT